MVDPRCTGMVDRIARFQMVDSIEEGQQRLIYHRSEMNPVASDKWPDTGQVQIQATAGDLGSEVSDLA